jgi:hypothetical protein
LYPIPTGLSRTLGGTRTAKSNADRSLVILGMVRIVRNLGRNGLNIHKKPFDVPSVASVGRVGAGVLPADHPQVGSALPPAGAAGLEETVARGRIVCADNAKGYPPEDRGLAPPALDRAATPASRQPPSAVFSVGHWIRGRQTGVVNRHLCICCEFGPRLHRRCMLHRLS